MRRTIATLLLTLFIPTTLAAQYIVVLRDGKRYNAKARWQVVDGKALIRLENGTTLQLDPSLIDVAATEQVNKAGLGDATVIGTSAPPAQSGTRAPEQSLGSVTRLREKNAARPDAGTAAAAASAIPLNVLDRYRNAYDNLGYYDANIRATGPDTMRVELVAENEQQVFNALSATAYLMEKLPPTTKVDVREVELHLLTLRGGYAGRFRMDRQDSTELESKTVTPQLWFVNNVIF